MRLEIEFSSHRAKDMFLDWFIEEDFCLELCRYCEKQGEFVVISSNHKGVNIDLASDWEEENE